ncbi:unnamed protein product [Citrullus colocynthis]|uniref:Uncharacterized protein n=1 Tax=Citrullus colocynthis TaxID=252529 RepID=A0ABP0YTW9_9ROSI
MSVIPCVYITHCKKKSSAKLSIFGMEKKASSLLFSRGPISLICSKSLTVHQFTLFSFNPTSKNGCSSQFLLVLAMGDELT